MSHLNAANACMRSPVEEILDVGEKQKFWNLQLVYVPGTVPAPKKGFEPMMWEISWLLQKNWIFRFPSVICMANLFIYVYQSKPLLVLKGSCT